MTPLLVSLPAPVLAAIGGHPGLWEDLRYQTVGLVVVLGALAAIWLVLEVVGAGFRRLERARAPVRVDPAARPPAAADEAAIPPEVVAVIAAAIHASVDTPHRIVAVQLADQGAGHTAWSVEGRREIYRSHRVR